MNSKQIFMVVAILATLSAVVVITPVLAQNVTGGNVTGGNVTGGNVTGVNVLTECKLLLTQLMIAKMKMKDEDEGGARGRRRKWTEGNN